MILWVTFQEEKTLICKSRTSRKHIWRLRNCQRSHPLRFKIDMYNPILFPYCCIHHHQCFLCRQNICRKFLFLANCFKMQNMPKNSSKSSSLKVYDHHPILFSHCCICHHERTCFMQIKYVRNFFWQTGWMLHNNMQKRSCKKIYP